MTTAGEGSQNIIMAPHPPSHFDQQEDLEPSFTRSLLSKELLQLPFEARRNISEEIHGVRSLAVDETPFVREDGLRRIHYELDILPRGAKLAYEKARSFPATYVNDAAFQLRFLRAELFNAKEAAKRMTTYLDLLLKNFGKEVLQRPLRITDFKAKDEKACLRSGIVQLLPYRDRSGRRVMVILSDIMSHDHNTREKIFLYLLTVAAECEETQQKGVLFVMWPGNETNMRMPPREERSCCEKAFSAFPIRLVGFHFCWPNTRFFYFIQSFFVLVMGSKNRTRVHFHTGERQELSSKLLCFGIPVQLLPTTESGVIKTKNHIQWFKTRQLLEKQASKRITTQPAKLIGAIECPTLNDVLYERTKPCMFHPGNSRFKGLIEAKKEEHALLSQTGKRDFAWSIVQEVEKRDGRFLTWDRKSGFWIQLQERSEIRLKVATSLRDFNKHSRVIPKVQTVERVCKVNFDDGQLTKKRRVVVSDDECSQGSKSCVSRGNCSNNEKTKSTVGGLGGLPLSLGFKPGNDLFKLSPQSDKLVSSGGPDTHLVAVDAKST